MNATIVLDGSWHWIHADKDYQQLCKEGDGWN